MNWKHPVLCILTLVFSHVISAQDFRVVHPGVEYAEVTQTISGLPVHINLLKLDLTKVRLDVVHAKNGIIGVEKTSSIAASHNAVAAINAGFFRLDTSPFLGEPAGILEIDGKLLSESTKGRVALEIVNDARSCKTCSIPADTTVLTIEHLTTFAEFWSSGNRANISGIDRELKDNDSVLYTPEFGTVTPPAKDKIIEVVIENKRIKSVTETNGGTAIPANGAVLAAAGLKKSELAGFAKAGGDAVTILGAYADQPKEANAKMKFIDVEDIVGGVPQLIRDGKIDITWEKEGSSKSFYETRHPRTAVAKLKDGKFLMITVDGRSESSGGIGLADLADYLLNLGAVDAMNLDGGGSTTMYLDGKVVNHPSDKEGERSVSDALVITLRQAKAKRSNGR